MRRAFEVMLAAGNCADFSIYINPNQAAVSTSPFKIAVNAIRLQGTQIECCDAIRIINSRDRQDTFFYLDPPYYNANMGHYDGYTIEDFELLLKTLSKIEGKFLLSSYPSDLLREHTKANGWNTIEITGSIGTHARAGKRKSKVEVLTANYGIHS